MRRGIERMVGDVLTEAKQKRLAPTRLGARCSVNYNFVDGMIKSGLLRVEQTRNGKVTVLTDKGLQALAEYESYQLRLSDFYKQFNGQDR